MDVPEVSHRTRSSYFLLYKEQRKRSCPLFFRSIRNLRFGVLLIAASLSASSIVISDTDTFPSTTGNSEFSAPDETYSFSFVVNTTPGVYNVDPGNYFDVDFLDFTYSLNGSPVDITPVDIRFFNTSQLGMFEICFTTACSFFNNPSDGFVFIGQAGQQMYTGPESAPTMLTGTFAPNFAYLYIDSNEYFEYFQNPRTPTHFIVAATNPVPEPSTILTLGAGFLSLLVAGYRRRRA